MSTVQATFTATPCHAYLKARGIPIELIDKLGLEIIGGTELRDKYKIPHPHAEQGILWRVKNLYGQDTGAIGARLFYASWGNTFSEAVKRDRPKFMGPKGQVSRLYHSPLVDWEKLDEGATVYLCESWLKADVMAMLGYFVVGVQGIYGWSWGQSKAAQNKQLREDFIALQRQKVKLRAFFDSNVRREKPMNYNALRRLKADCAMLDLSVDWRPLPMSDDGDWGIDDYYTLHGADGVRELLEEGVEEIPDDVKTELLAFDTEVIACNAPPCVIERSTGQIFKDHEARKHRWADRWHMDVKIGSKYLTPTPVSTYDMWTKWEGKTRVKAIDYRPGDGQIEPGEWYNSWRGSGVEPVLGDCSLWESWLESHIDDEAAREWFADWLAHQMQHPMIRMPQACMLLGPQGTGKGWVADLLRRVLGSDNVAFISLNDLVKEESAHYTHKQMVIVEEADTLWKTGETTYRRLKEWVTAPMHRHRALYFGTRMVEARGHMLLQGNDLDIAQLEADDRRFGVIWLTGEQWKGDPDYWGPRWKWGESLEGQQAWLNWLLTRDLQNFSPNVPPPITRAKRQMVSLTMDPDEQWLREVMADPDSVLIDALGAPLGGRCFSIKELVVIADGLWLEPLSQVRMARCVKFSKLLERVGMRYVNSTEHNPSPKLNVGRKGYPRGPQRYVVVRGNYWKEPDEGWHAHIRNRSINEKLNRN